MKERKKTTVRMMDGVMFVLMLCVIYRYEGADEESAEEISGVDLMNPFVKSW